MERKSEEERTRFLNLESRGNLWFRVRYKGESEIEVSESLYQAWSVGSNEVAVERMSKSRRATAEKKGSKSVSISLSLLLL